MELDRGTPWFLSSPCSFLHPSPSLFLPKYLLRGFFGPELEAQMLILWEHSSCPHRARLLMPPHPGAVPCRTMPWLVYATRGGTDRLTPLRLCYGETKLPSGVRFLSPRSLALGGAGCCVVRAPVPSAGGVCSGEERSFPAASSCGREAASNGTSGPGGGLQPLPAGAFGGDRSPRRQPARSRLACVPRTTQAGCSRVLTRRDLI